MLAPHDVAHVVGNLHTLSSSTTWPAVAAIGGLAAAVLTAAFRAGHVSQRLTTLEQTVALMTTKVSVVARAAELHPAHAGCPLLLLQEPDHPPVAGGAQ